MDITERDRAAAMFVALRPDFASNGIDRLRGMREWLTKNVMDWSYQDVVVGLALVALDPASNGPGRLMTDGPWRTITRTLAGTTTEHPPTDAERGAECAVCGVRAYRHKGQAILLGFDGNPLGAHDWTPAQDAPASRPETIARFRPTFTRGAPDA